MMRQVLGLIVLAVLMSGCGGGGGMFGSSSAGTTAAEGSSASVTDRIANFFDTGGSSRQQRPDGTPPQPDDITCPPVTVRQGTATLAYYAAREESPLNLRYQTSIGRTARDCKVVGNSVVMKVGVEGRVILGPAGGPGKIEVPLRFGVVEEGPTPKAITSKFYRVPVTIDGSQGNVPFVQIDEELTFPLAPIDQLQKYVVYVGFDPEGLRSQPRRTRTRR